VRTTDALASHNESLEGQARRAAEEQMRAAAIAEGIFDHARAGAERTLRALLRPLGYEHVEIEWPEKS
jgi:P2-related tail formation protein